MRTTGQLNEYSRLQTVAVRHPRAAFTSQAVVDALWADLNFHDRPNYDDAVAEFEAFCALLRNEGVSIEWLPQAKGLSLDSIYVRDATVLAPAGVIATAMGKPQRAKEPAAAASIYREMGYDELGRIGPPGRLEGGDLVWLDPNTVVVGHTYRTNPIGIAQLQEMLGPAVRVISVQMPHFQGRNDVFHLMSVFSPLDRDLALVHLPLMPVALVELLESRGIAFVEVDEGEFASMACNVLAIAPRVCLALDGNPKTSARLASVGCRVLTYSGRNISRLGEGGPTCLTRPLTRTAS